MSRAICSDAIVGAREVVARAKALLASAIRAKGADQPVAFPGTAYFLPVIYSMTGEKVATLADLELVLARCEQLLPEKPSDALWLPYLGDALDAGMATLFAFETIEACKTIMGPPPVNGIWLGAADDVIMRERGIEFVDGTAPGFAAVVGAAPDAATAVRIATQLQEKNLYVFMSGHVNGTTFAEQLHSEGVQLGWETRLVPFGRDVSATIYSLGFANRAALSFGGVAPGDFERNLRYNKNRIFAFVLALGEVDQEKYAAAAGAINYGFPTIADTDIPEILPTGVCTYEHVVSNVPHDVIVERALEVRGCKVKVAKVPIPVPYGPAFEGERIRKNEARAEFGGNVTTAFEFVCMREMDEIEDGRIDVIGRDVDEIEEGGTLPLAIWVEVAGRKMQPDFEPILERQIHHLLNGAEGVWHMGQRDIVWTRISKKGFDRGLRLRHYGEILHAKLLYDYPAIVDKVQITLITDADEVERRIATARKVYVERNRRLESMADESVDVFYSCLLCQSFAPNHVCMITPERLGLCGAYNWLDGKAAHEIDETGPNQPVAKGHCVDPVRGIWEGVNEYVHIHSHGTVSCYTAYSLMDRPMTSCGCFEAIVAYVPECNGVIIVNREFTGETPVGMTFSTLAGSVGGGVQTPGFMGVGKAFLSSRKFLAADGGFPRVVWMTRELKDAVGEDLAKRAAESGHADLLDKIADETVAIEPDAIRAHMKKVGHPALDMPDMAALWAAAAHGVDPRPPDSKPPDRTEVPAPVGAEGEADPDPAISPAMHIDKETLLEELKAELKEQITQEIVAELMATLQDKFLGERKIISQVAAERTSSENIRPHVDKPAAPARCAAEKLADITAFDVPKEKLTETIQLVALGATGARGGTRGRVITVGGQNCLPFHYFEGSVPHPPVLALEVFDKVSDRCSPVLRELWGDLLQQPSEMARKAVDEYGADLISVRLEGTHPEKGNRTLDESLALVRDVLAAVDVPLIITAHNHYESANEVLKKVAAGCAGERLLLNWVEADNYRTIAGAALAYDHCLVAQSPIDVNLAKQLNILLANMDLPRERIVMDPLAGALGYGLEYTYSVMERIRLTGLTGDRALTFPMLVHVGQEAWKVKEAHAPSSAFPEWGDLTRRAVAWEVQTAMPLVLAGADIVILHHPLSLSAIRRNVTRLAMYCST
ncbi:MAG: CO dehydrogenase/CO-methylating acetyl-CoA synthase complex subunit beta [Phycisphaerales bacterium]|nr:MAG: CO dehydrogenase/CO-methylating acetyl-CoA synthase complex subunit beta [Phycisphaerales bacterium]